MKSIIFDLDQTLVDSSTSSQERKNRNWSNVYSMIPNFILYDGCREVFKYINEHGIKVALVSTAPNVYVTKVAAYYQIPQNVIIGYHDAKPIKPHPASFLKAIELLGETPKNIISFGDRLIDIQAAQAANVISVACLWGSQEVSQLNQSKADYIISKPIEMLTLLQRL